MAGAQAVADAAELLPYFMQRAAGEVDMRQAQGRSGYTRRMLDLLRRLPDRVEQDSYVPQLAQLAGIDERVLRDELARGGAAGPASRPAVDDRPARSSRGAAHAARAPGVDPSAAEPDARRASWRRGSGCRSGTNRRRRWVTPGGPRSRPERQAGPRAVRCRARSRDRRPGAQHAGIGPVARRAARARAAIARSCASASCACASSASRSSSTTCRRSSAPPRTTRHPSTSVSWNNGSRS